MNLFTFLRSLLPPAVGSKFDTVMSAARALLQGEPVRAIGYGAVVVVFLVTRGAEAAGHPLAIGSPTLDAIALAVAGAVTAVVEFARQFVSPVGSTTSPSGK